MAVEAFEVCHEITARWEGGWSDHPADPGGKTMFGVTEAVYHDWLRTRGRPMKPVREITKSEALTIYRRLYWLPIAEGLWPGVNLAAYDAAVNSGVGRARKWLAASIGSTDHTVTVKRLCAKRLSFVRGLKTWKTFGKGWARRVADIEARGVAMALKASGASSLVVQAQLQEEQHKAVQAQLGQKAGASGGGAVGVGASATDPSGLLSAHPWIVAGVLAVAVVLVVWLLLRARINRQRGEAYAAVAAEQTA